MAATGNEAVTLEQLKRYADNISYALTRGNYAVQEPVLEPTEYPVYLGMTSAESGTVWLTLSSVGTTYEGTAPIVVSGSTISITEAGEGVQGTVAFASDADFNDYMGIVA